MVHSDENVFGGGAISTLGVNFKINILKKKRWSDWWWSLRCALALRMLRLHRPLLSVWQQEMFCATIG